MIVYYSQSFYTQIWWEKVSEEILSYISFCWRCQTEYFNRSLKATYSLFPFYYHHNRPTKRNIFHENMLNGASRFCIVQLKSTFPSPQRNCLSLHTHIIDHYNLSIRITTKLLTPLALCVLILCMCCRTYKLKLTPNYRFLILFLWQFYVPSEFLLEICWDCWEEESEKIYFQIPFCWKCLTLGLSQALTPNKPTHYLLDYGDLHAMVILLSPLSHLYKYKQIPWVRSKNM